MNSDFLHQLIDSNAHRAPREANARVALTDPSALKILIRLATDPSAQGHHQAWWSIEIVTEMQRALIEPPLADLVRAMPRLRHDGAIRSASKICMIFCQKALNDLEPSMQTQIRDICLDWLTSDSKVAAKAYSARALFEFGKNDSKLLNELRDIMEVGFPNHSAAYKAVARELIKKIARKR